MKLRRIVSLLLTTALLALRPSFANDTETGFTAGQPYPLKSTSLRLVAEDLRVSLEPAFANVEITFTLKNEGAPRDVVLGFPYFDGADRSADGYNYVGGLEDFECTVDGRSAALTARKSRSLDPLFKVTRWYTWTVHFERGQTRKVAHRFRAMLGGSTAAEAPNVPGPLVKTFYYILTTARNWKAPIGDFRLTIRALPPLKLSDIAAVSEGVQVENGALVAHRTTFTPSQELRIQLFARYLRDPLAWTNPGFVPRTKGRLQSAYPPDTPLAMALRAAVEAHYKKKVKASWTDIYNIVAYKKTYFAATNQHDRTALWERVAGQWRFITDYPEGPNAPSQDALYRRVGFSPMMQRKLEQGAWSSW